MKSASRGAGVALMAAVGVASLRLQGGGHGEVPGGESGRGGQAVRGQSGAALEKMKFTGACTAYRAEREVSAVAGRHRAGEAGGAAGAAGGEAAGGVGGAAGYPKDDNEGDAKKVLDRFFGLPAERETWDAGGLPSRKGVRYAVALAPDPRHTNLSIVFDRDMEAIEQAAQDDDYTYNSSWLPWTGEGLPFSRLEDQQRRADLVEARESCPGVLLFRKSAAANPSATGVYDEALVVFVVGEQPTGGINVGQWRTAMEWLRLNAPAAPQPLRVLGPSFSGSLPSLLRELAVLDEDVGAGLDAGPKHRFTRADVFSGTVASCSSIRTFRAQLTSQVTFHVFQENDEVQIYRFLSYLRNQGMEARETAILSEDETAYSYAGVPKDASGPPEAPDSKGVPAAPVCDFDYDHSNRPVRLFYPRDISALRSAYQKESVFGSGGAAAARAVHSILQAGAEAEGEGSAPDTVQSYSGQATPLGQEAVLYDIVSELRTHHTHFLLLRCTNPLDYLFLTRFFHRAYPQGRIVTVGQDLLFRREIDTTEFRGVMALTSYPLLPRNQHWSLLSKEEGMPAHRHRIFESHTAEGIYMAGRYLFADTGAAAPVRLDLMDQLPEYADPFWLHKPGEVLQTMHPPSWLTVVGRDGSWPVAVLNDATTPDETLGDEGGKEAGRRPVSTMVALENGTGKAHFDLARGGKRFSPAVLLGFPLAWKGFFLGVVALLLYQISGVARGRRNPSSGVFSVFRPAAEVSQNVLLGLNSFFALLLLLELVSFLLVEPWMGALVEPGWGLPGCGLVLLVAIYLMGVGFFHPRRPWAWRAGLLCLVVVLGLTVALGAASLNRANATPTFYRMVHLASGVAPLLPVLLLTVGFYLWTWQATAGNLMLCHGRPVLPRLESAAAKQARQAAGERRAWDVLRSSQFRISREIERSIVRIARPFGIPPEVIAPPLCVLPAALAVFWRDPPLLGLESKGFAMGVDLVLLLAFLVTLAEAARLLFTWIELRRLLTALGRQRLRRTFARLRPISASSLWSMSGSVQRVQYFIFAQQLDAAARLAGMLAPKGSTVPVEHEETTLRSVVDAVRCGRKFAEENAPDLVGSPRWYEGVVRPRDGRLVDLREVFADAAAVVLEHVLRHRWAAEDTSLNLELGEMHADEDGNVFHLELNEDPVVQVAEEFVCFHYLAFIQTILARLRTIALSMVCLFVAMCFAISSYPFLPRTQVGVWMVVNLLVICFAVLYVYAGMERDEILSYISNTRPGRLGGEFWLKAAGFLAGPVIGIATTQFPAIADSLLGWLQPGIDAVK